MQVSRKKLMAMIEEEAQRSARLEETSVRNVKEPLNAEELDMLDLLLTRQDLYGGEVPAGFDPEVFGNAIDAVAELYKAAQEQQQQQQGQPPSQQMAGAGFKREDY